MLDFLMRAAVWVARDCWILVFSFGVLEKGLISHSRLQACSHLRGWRPRSVPTRPAGAAGCALGAGAQPKVWQHPSATAQGAQHIRYTQPLHPTIACSHITMISRNKEEGNTQPWKGWCMGSEGRQRGEGDCVRRRGHTAETFRMVRENAFREGEKGGHSPPCTLKFRSSKKHKHRLSVLWIWGAGIKMSMHLHLARWELRVCRQI